MLSTIFVDVHPKLHMFIKLWSNISVLYNSRSLSNNNNALTNSIPTNIFHRTNLRVVNSHSFIWNVQQKIRNILCMICYIFFSIPLKPLIYTLDRCYTGMSHLLLWEAGVSHTGPPSIVMKLSATYLRNQRSVQVQVNLFSLRSR